MTAITYTGALSEREHFSSVLYDDALYIFGGWTSGMLGSYIEDIRKYTIATSTWTTITTSGNSLDRCSYTANVYNDNMYIIGGMKREDDVSTYNLATSTFTVITYTGTFPGRYYHTGTLYNTMIYVIGGCLDTGSVTYNDVLTFNIATSTWSSISYTGTFNGRKGHSATLYNNAIYVIGGFAKFGYLNEVKKYTIATSTWTTVATTGSIIVRYAHTATLYKDVIYVIGGRFDDSDTTNAGTLNDVQMFTIATSTWTSIPYSGTLGGRYGHAATLYNNDIFIIAGKASGTSYPTTDYNDVNKFSIMPAGIPVESLSSLPLLSSLSSLSSLTLIIS